MISLSFFVCSFCILSIYLLKNVVLSLFDISPLPWNYPTFIGRNDFFYIFYKEVVRYCCVARKKFSCTAAVSFRLSLLVPPPLLFNCTTLFPSNIATSFSQYAARRMYSCKVHMIFVLLLTPDGAGDEPMSHNGTRIERRVQK